MRIDRNARPSKLNASSRIRLSGNAPAPRKSLPVVRVLCWLGVIATAAIVFSNL